jgi:creatinine amidohydrolase
MPGRPYLIAETNWKAVRNTSYELAVLPWGATEAHNFHLPYATDNLQVDHVAADAAGRAWDRGARVAVLPCVPFGVNTGQREIPFCLNMMPSTQAAVLEDIATAVEGSGVKKLVILNGHGGNHFRQMIRELGFRHPEMFVCVLNWYEAADWNQYFDEPGDHAGEMETSCIQLIAPDLPLPLSEAGDGSAFPFRPSALREGWAWAERNWPKATRDTGVGNPAKADPKKAERYLNAVSENIATFFTELAACPIGELYETEETSNP